MATADYRELDPENVRVVHLSADFKSTSKSPIPQALRVVMAASDGSAPGETTVRMRSYGKTLGLNELEASVNEGVRLAVKREGRWLRSPWRG